MRRRRQSVAGALCALAGVLTITAPSALAGERGGGDRYEQRRYDPSYAGTIIIDGCAYDLTSRRPVGGQLVAELGRRGYRAWCEGGKVFVRRGYKWPKISWRSGSYRVSIQYSGDCVVLCPSLNRYERHGPYDGGRATKTVYRAPSGRNDSYRGGSMRDRGWYESGRYDSGRHDRRGRTNMPYPPRSSREICSPRSGWSGSARYRTSGPSISWSWSSRSCDDGSSRRRRGHGRR